MIDDLQRPYRVEAALRAARIELCARVDAEEDPFDGEETLLGREFLAAYHPFGRPERGVAAITLFSNWLTGQGSSQLRGATHRATSVLPCAFQTSARTQR